MLKKGLCHGGLRRDLDLPEAFARAKEAGFDGVEMALTPEGRVAWDPPYDQPEKVAQAAQAVGLELPSTMGPSFLHLFDREPAETLPEIKALTERGCQAAQVLGAEAILQIPGYVQLAWETSSRPIPYEVAWERAVTIYRELGPIAEAHQVTLCVENVWNKFLLSPLEMRHFVEAIDHDYVQVYFDVGNHLFCGFPEQWIRLLGSRIRRIHLKDFRMAVGNLNAFVMLLEGDVNWTEVMQAVTEVGYEGYLTAEYGVYPHSPDTLLEHLSSSMDRIMALAASA